MKGVDVAIRSSIGRVLLDAWRSGRWAGARSAAGLLGVTAVAGCFSYVPVDPSAVPSEEEVRVHFTEEARFRVGRDLGTITDRLDGRLGPREGDSLSLSVWIGRDYPGTPFADMHQTVSLARRDIIDVRRRKFSPARTALVGAGVVAFWVVLIDRVILQENPNPGGPDNPGNPPPGGSAGVRLPLF